MGGQAFRGWLIGGVIASSAAAIEPPNFTQSCGNARPDVQVCLLWNQPVQRGNLSFRFHGEKRDDVTVTRSRGERPGIDWYVGTGIVDGTRLSLWLRVDDSGALLPVSPRPPRTAAVFYRVTPNGKWQPYPLTTQFLFAEVKR